MTELDNLEPFALADLPDLMPMMGPPLVPFEELTGSPTQALEQRSFTAQRKLKVNWADVSALTASFLPYPGNIFASFPGQPFLVVNKIAVAPFPDTAPNIFPSPYTDPASYQYAVVTIDYKVPVYDNGQWGDTSPRNNQPAANSDTVLSDKVTYGGEFLIIKAAALQWSAPWNATLGQYNAVPAGSFLIGCTVASEVLTTVTLTFNSVISATVGQTIVLSGFTPSGYNGTWTIGSISTIGGQTLITFTAVASGMANASVIGSIFLPPVSGGSGIVTAPTASYSVRVQEDISAGRFIPILEHTINWHFVLFPPWTAIRNSVGSVNKASFAQCPRGTLLFCGCEASIDFTAVSTKFWTLQMKFSYKNNGAGIGNSQGGGSNPFDISAVAATGWNYYLRPETGTFEELNVKALQRITRNLVPGGGGPFGATPATVQVNTTTLSPSQPIYRYTDFTPLFQPGM